MWLVALPAALAMLEARGVPPLPDGRQLSLELGSFDDAGTGGQMWPAASVLCRWQARNTDSIAGARVMELGTGTGACGLFAAALGARRVLLTDGGPPGVLPLARRNAWHNRNLAPASVVSVEPLLWGFNQPLPAENFDLVLASDVAYHNPQPLAFTLRQLLLQRPSAPPRIVLAQQHRTNSDGADALAEFCDLVRTFGMRATTLWNATESLWATQGRDEDVSVSVLEIALDHQADPSVSHAAVAAAAAAGTATTVQRLIF